MPAEKASTNELKKSEAGIIFLSLCASHDCMNAGRAFEGSLSGISGGVL